MIARFNIRRALLVTALVAVWVTAYAVGEQRYGGWRYAPFFVRAGLLSTPVVIWLIFACRPWWLVVLGSGVAGVVGATMHQAYR